MMSNPHVKESSFLHYLEEKIYIQDNWYDTGLWVEVGGLGLIICTITISGGYTTAAGVRIVDENDLPLPPYRTKNNNRHPVHFTFEPNGGTRENQTPVTFHMIANCQYAKLQVRPSDEHSALRGDVYFNRAASGLRTPTDAIWNHKTISTMSVIPLVPTYQPGANTVFTYSQSRMPRMSEDDKPEIKYDKNKRKIT